MGEPGIGEAQEVVYGDALRDLIAAGMDLDWRNNEVDRETVDFIMAQMFDEAGIDAGERQTTPITVTVIPYIYADERDGWATGALFDVDGPDEESDRIVHGGGYATTVSETDPHDFVIDGGVIANLASQAAAKGTTIEAITTEQPWRFDSVKHFQDKNYLSEKGLLYLPYELGEQYHLEMELFGPSADNDVQVGTTAAAFETTGEKIWEAVDGAVTIASVLAMAVPVGGLCRWRAAEGRKPGPAGGATLRIRRRGWPGGRARGEVRRLAYTLVQVAARHRDAPIRDPVGQHPLHRRPRRRSARRDERSRHGYRHVQSHGAQHLCRDAGQRRGARGHGRKPAHPAAPRPDWSRVRIGRSPGRLLELPGGQHRRSRHRRLSHPRRPAPDRPAGEDATAWDRLMAAIGPAMLTMGGLGMRHDSKLFNNHLNQNVQEYVGSEVGSLPLTNAFVLWMRPCNAKERANTHCLRMSKGARRRTLALDMSNKAAFINSLFDADVRDWTVGGLQGAIQHES